MKILYEDENILAIDKPSGISVHPALEQAQYGAGPDGKTRDATVTDWVLENYPEMKNVGEPLGEILRPGVVHRLDKDTSGILLLAKNQKAHAFLKEQFVNREIKKIYIAVVSGYLKNDIGIIDKPIGRSPSDFRRRLAGRGARGELREAVTEYKVLKRFMAPACENFSSCALPVTKKETGGTLGDKNLYKPLPFTLLEIYPKTGRTHQIRVHMKYLNHPIVCDPLYNPNGPCPKDIGRLALHAKSIEFKNFKGEEVAVEAPIPEEFKEACPALNF